MHALDRLTLNIPWKVVYGVYGDEKYVEKIVNNNDETVIESHMGIYPNEWEAEAIVKAVNEAYK